MGWIPGLGRSPGGGNGNTLQYSYQGNPKDRGTWWATVYWVAKNWTQLSMNTHTHTHTLVLLCSPHQRVKYHLLYSFPGTITSDNIIPLCLPSLTLFSFLYKYIFLYFPFKNRIKLSKAIQNKLKQNSFLLTCLLLKILTFLFFRYQFQKVLQVIIELFNFSFFSMNGRGIGLDYSDIEWFALKTKQRSFCHF